MGLLSIMGKIVKTAGKAAITTYAGLTGFYIYRYLTDDKAKEKTEKKKK